MFNKIKTLAISASATIDENAGLTERLVSNMVGLLGGCPAELVVLNFHGENLV